MPTHCHVFDWRYLEGRDAGVVMEQYAARNAMTLLRVRMVQGVYIADFDRK